MVQYTPFLDSSITHPYTYDMGAHENSFFSDQKHE